MRIHATRQVPALATVNGFASLEKLKIYQKFAFPNAPRWVDNFPLFMGPVTQDIVVVLDLLVQLSELIPKDKNCFLYRNINPIMDYSLQVARELTSIHIKNRREKIAALTAALHQVITLASNPRTHTDLGTVKQAGIDMDQKVDSLLSNALMRTITWYVYNTITPTNNYDNNPEILPELSVLEKKALADQENESTTRYHFLKQYMNELTIIEAITVNDNYAATSALFKKISELNNFTSDQNEEIKYLFQTICTCSFNLTLEIGRATQDTFLGTSRATKLAAIQKTIDALIIFNKNPHQAGAKEQLFNAAYAMRNAIENYYLMRHENRLLRMVVGTIIALIGLAQLTTMILVAPAALFTAIPLTLTLTSFLIIFSTGFGLLTKAIYSSESTLERNSKAIYEEIKHLQQIKLIDYSESEEKTMLSTANFEPRITTLKETYELGASVLVNLKNLQNIYNSPETRKNYADLLQKFPLDFNNVTIEVVDILKELDKLNDVAIKCLTSTVDKSAYYSDIIFKSLQLVTAINAGNKDKRKQKLTALKEALHQMNLIIAQPLQADNLNNLVAASNNIHQYDAFHDATKNMKNTIDPRSYLRRFENRILGGAVSVSGSVISGCVMVVGGIILCPFNVALSAFVLTVSAVTLAISINLGLTHIFPTQEYDLSKQSFDLQTALLQFKKSPIPATNGLLTPPPKNELDVLNKKIKDTLQEFDDYMKGLNNLRVKWPLPTLDSLCTIAIYEKIKTDYLGEFSDLFGNLQRLNEAYNQNKYPLYRKEIGEIFVDAINLANDIAQENFDFAVRIARKEKIKALNNTITQTLVFLDAQNETAKVDLIKACWELRNAVEGKWFRKENRVLNGIIGAITTILSGALFAVTLATVVTMPPTAPLAYTLLTSLSGMMASCGLYFVGSISLAESIRPTHPEQQDNSKSIYTTACLFKPVKKEEVQEEKDQLDSRNDARSTRQVHFVV